MTPATSHLRLLVFTGGLLRLVIAWLPLEWLLNHVLSDDSFYYFTIARTSAYGGGISFDGLAPTNGFHPLWLALIAPIYSCGLDGIPAIHAVLTLSALLDTCALVVLVLILRDLGIRTGVTALVAALYACAPVLLTYAGPLNGLETALNALMVYLLLFLYFSVLRERPRWFATAPTLGICCGATILARIDNIVIVAVLLPVLFASRRTGRLRFAATATGALLAVVSPWIAWNLSVFGTVQQVSGEAYAFSVRGLHAVADWGVSEYGMRFLKNCFDVVRFFPLMLGTDTKFSTAFVLMAFTLGTSALMITRSLLRNPGSTRTVFMVRCRILAGPVLAAVGFILVHSLKSITLRGWYYATVTYLVFPAFAAAADYSAVRMRAGWRRFVAAGVVFCCLVFGAVSRLGSAGDRPGELDKYDAVQVMNEIIPAGSRVGSWNAGLYGYFFEKGPVINLDGLVNNEAFRHLTRRALAEYCREVRVEFLVDAAGVFTLWDPYWSRERHGLVHSITPVRIMRQENPDHSIIIARLHLFHTPR